MSTLAPGKVPQTSFEAQAGVTLDTNFFGTLAVTRAMLPLLRESDWQGASGQLTLGPSRLLLLLLSGEISSLSYYHCRRA